MAKLIFLLVLAFAAYVAAYPSPQDLIQSLPERVKRTANPNPQFFGFNPFGLDHIHPGPGHYDGHYGGFHGGHRHGGHYDLHYPYGHFGPGHWDWHSDYY